MLVRFHRPFTFTHTYTYIRCALDIPHDLISTHPFLAVSYPTVVRSVVGATVNSGLLPLLLLLLLLLLYVPGLVAHRWLWLVAHQITCLKEEGGKDNGEFLTTAT